MATSGRGSGVVGYNVQVAVETNHHLIVTHDVTTSGSDRAQLSRVGKAAKAVMQVILEAVDDRGYFNSTEILACQEAGHHRDNAKADDVGCQVGWPLRQEDFVYLPDEDVYRCLAGGRLTYRYSNEEDGKEATLLDDGVLNCPLKPRCTTGRSDGLRDGRTSMCSKLCSSGSMPTRTPCASGERRSSIRPEPLRLGWARPTS